MKCTTCDGSGWNLASEEFFPDTQSTCFTCGGTGSVPDDCKFCKGTGKKFPDQPKVTCPHCGGTRKKFYSRRY